MSQDQSVKDIQNKKRKQVESLLKHSDFSMDSLANICTGWIKQNQDDPLPYYYQACGYLLKEIHLDSASLLISTSLDLMLMEKKYVQNKIIDPFIPSAYLTSAKISLKQKKYSAALAQVKCGEECDRYEMYPSLYFIEGNIWNALNKNELAESAYFKAWRRGDDEAEDSLKNLFVRENGNELGYSLYIKMLADKMMEQAPLFETLTYDGKPIKLEDYRGKVVVLTFWFIGCPGCEMEIPSLNRLVKFYQDKKVAFIALARDSDKRIEDYLQRKEFLYTHIAGAESVIKKYGVETFPTHIIIDAEGRLDSKSVGGNDEMDEILKKYIERALNL